MIRQCFLKIFSGGNPEKRIHPGFRTEGIENIVPDILQQTHIFPDAFPAMRKSPAQTIFVCSVACRQRIFFISNENLCGKIPVQRPPGQVHQPEIRKQPAERLPFAETSDVVKTGVEGMRHSPGILPGECLKGSSRHIGLLQDNDSESPARKNAAALKSAGTASYYRHRPVHLNPPV